MKQTSILQGLLLALLLAPLSLIAFGITALFLTAFGATKLALITVGFSYICYLMCRKRTRTGRTTLGLVALLALGWLFFYSVNLTLIAIAVAALIWFIRSVLRYRSFWSAIADGFLTLASLAFASWVYAASHSFVVAVWAFFLVQALFPLIPPKFFGNESPTEPVSSDEEARFQRACSAADEALQQLVARS